MFPSASIVMVMKNERRNLERSFDLISGQSFGGMVEIVYVDSGSTDGTIEFMRERGVEAICIPPADFHHGRTRNLAAEHARNDVLVFLSGDAIPLHKDWLRNLVAPFQDPRVGGVYGKQVPPEGTGALRAHAMAAEYPNTPFERDLSNEPRLHPGLFRFSNANSAVRRELWSRFRFNETLLLAEDQGMCRDILMAGYKVAYVPDAAVIHGHERNAWGELRFAFENGLSLTRMNILRNPEIGGEFGYGLRRVRDDFKYFASRGEPINAAGSLGINALKWLGVQLGKRENKLPLWLAARISPGVRKVRA